MIEAAITNAAAISERLPAVGERQPRPAQDRQHDQDGIFRHPREHMRREKRGGDAADHAAGRHPHVERSQVAGRRTAAGQLAMAYHRGDEERRDVQQHDQRQVVVHAVDDGRDQRDQQCRLEEDHGAVRQQRLPLKHDHEGQEIEREGHDPQERGWRDVGGQMRGHRDQHPRGDRRKCHPDGGIPPARPKPGFLRDLRITRGRPRRSRDAARRQRSARSAHKSRSPMQWSAARAG